MDFKKRIKHKQHKKCKEPPWWYKEIKEWLLWLFAVFVAISMILK